MALASVLATLGLAANWTPDAQAAATTAARYTSLEPVGLAHALRLGRRWYFAGVSRYQIGPGIVPTFALTFGTTPDLDGGLRGINAGSTSINDLAESTKVTTCARAAWGEGPTANVSAAADQLAIWFFSDGLAIDRHTVPNGRLLATTERVVLRAEHHPACHPTQDNLGHNGLSNATPAPSVSVTTGSTPSDDVLTITLGLGPFNRHLSFPQALEVFINGVPAYVCTGQTTRVDIATIHHVSHVAPGATESNPRPQCGRNFSPGTQLQYRLLSASPAFVLVNGHHLASKRTEPSQGYSTAVVRFRRRSFAEHIRVIWNSTSGPGVIYLASQGHTSVITAGSSSPDVDAQTSIGPPGLSGFEATIEEQIIPFFADQGTLGVILFVLTLALLVSFKQVLGFVVNGLARVVRSIRGKTRGTGSAPSGQ